MKHPGSHFGDCLHSFPSIVLIAARSANPVVSDNSGHVLIPTLPVTLPGLDANLSVLVCS
jgi:hypothetical protein